MFNRILKSLVICSLFVFCISCTKIFQEDLKLIPVKSGEKWGYINKKGDYVINPQFVDADFFVDGLARVISSDWKTGYISENGEYKIPAKYKNGTSFSDGLAFVVSDGDYPACIDKSGEIKFQLKQAKIAFGFSEGLAVFVNSDEKFGFVDKTGKVVLSPQFESIYPFSEGLAAVKQKDKWGFIDKTGKMVINPQFEDILPFSEGKAAFYDGKQWGFIDKTGKYVINPQFEGVGLFSEGMAVVMSGKECGYITENGKTKITPQFDDAANFRCGLALIKQDGKYGFIDKTGKLVIYPQFDISGSFIDGIAFVKIADKWGIVNKKGEYIVNLQFDNIITDRSIYFLAGFSYDFVISDYYNAIEFINKFFEKAGDNSFDGFTALSTLQSIVDNAIYGDEIEANDEYSAFCLNTQKMNSEISIDKTWFHFTNPIYEKVKTSDSWEYRTETSKNYKFAANISAIEYQFNLSGNASDKGSSIASALKKEIERRYNVKMKTEKAKYTIYRDNMLSFAIFYGDYSLILYIGFDREKLQNILSEMDEFLSKMEKTLSEIPADEYESYYDD
jgi:hypothetical protein